MDTPSDPKSSNRPTVPVRHGPFAAVIRLALAHQGMVSSTEATAAGIDPRTLARLARAGILRKVRRGLYCLPADGESDRPRPQRLADELSAALSHQTAAEFYGCPITESETTHLLVPHPRHPRSRPGLVIHRTSHFGPLHVRRHRGVLTTTPGRTLADLCAPALGVTHKGLIACIDHFVLTRRSTLKALDSFGERSGKLPGLSRLKVILANLGSELIESHAERHLLDVITTAGLPRPVTQFTLRSQPPQRSFIARLDFAWPDQRVALELDGKQHHGLARLDSDRERGNEIEAAGWRLLRTSPSSARAHPDALLQALRNVIATSAEAAVVSRSG